MTNLHTSQDRKFTGLQFIDMYVKQGSLPGPEVGQSDVPSNEVEQEVQRRLPIGDEGPVGEETPGALEV